jgi:hypothetical protein
VVKRKPAPTPPTGTTERGGRAESGERSSVKSQTRQTSIERRARGSEITIRGRSRSHVRVSSGSREDIVLKRRRAHGVVVYNDEPERRVIIKKRRHPSITVGETSRIVTRSHGGGDVNIRTSVRSRETTSGSATTVNRSQSSATSKGSLSGGKARGAAASQSGGNATGGNARGTTGQAPTR